MNGAHNYNIKIYREKMSRNKKNKTTNENLSVFLLNSMHLYALKILFALHCVQSVFVLCINWYQCSVILAALK